MKTLITKPQAGFSGVMSEKTTVTDLPYLRENLPQDKTIKTNKSLLTLLLQLLVINCSLLIATADATIRYVSPHGSNQPPYLTPETAANKIQDCIDVSEPYDTIYVANGVYKEKITMITGLRLIGAGIDSCIVDTRELAYGAFIAISVVDSCLLSGFNIIVANSTEIAGGISLDGNGSLVKYNGVTNSGIGILISNTDNTIYNNICTKVTTGLYLFNSNSIVRQNYIFTSDISGARGIYIGGFNFSYKPVIDSNFIIGRNRGIDKSFGTNPTITNNIIILPLVGSMGIFLSSSDSAIVKNNLIIAANGGLGIRNSATPHLKLHNNYFTGNFSSNGYIMFFTADNSVKNNVISNSESGKIRAWNNSNLEYKYNNVWNSNLTYEGFLPDTTNLFVDPMIMNDDTTKGELDFRLQMYSPLIDAGDPDILDKDGSRSDIGLYGGPYGWSYTYEDLAPRPPRNLTAAIIDGLVKLTWNKNTEADFSHYRIYRDTVSNFIYDSTKIVAETVDTVYFDNLPISNAYTNFYYKLTAFDNQGNQSEPSEEIAVIVTGMTEHPPIGYDGYKLLSNYPNPFNPSTIIPYRLKEGGYVKLYIYDIKGELVRVLVNEWQEKGYYEVVFYPDAGERARANSFEVPMGRRYNQIATGVYLYQIMVRGEGDIPVFTDMGKMILLK